MSLGLRRDRRTVCFALLAVSALSWLYVVNQTGSDSGPMADMGSMSDMGGMGSMDANPGWDASTYLLTLMMWVVMMAAMMLPTVIPLTLVYAASARKARRDNSSVPSTAVFVGGYLLVWAAFSVVATTAQWMLDRSMLLSDNFAVSRGVGAALLIAAGVYEFTPLKRVCLRQCRGPVEFITSHWHPGVLGVARMGVSAGLYCLGCCWLVMALLFVGGVMNLLWVAVISVVVLLEKVGPGGETLSRVLGFGLIVAGAAGLVAVGSG
jgi:predicted metal-binding membrane protein